MLTLYGNEISSPSNKTRFVVNALGIPHEYQRIDLMKGENKTEAFLKINPAGKVPALQDGDFSLFESNAILRYLADRESSSLYPKDLKRRALVDQWLDFASLHVGTSMARVFVNRVLYKAMNLEKDERSLSDGLAFLSRFLPVVDGQLQKSAFLAGPELTLADFGLLANVDTAEISAIDLSPYPHLKRWQEGLMAKDFYQKCYPSYAKMLQEVAAKLAK